MPSTIDPHFRISGTKFGAITAEEAARWGQVMAIDIQLQQPESGRSVVIGR